jgi:hypothetical protein
MAGVAFGLCALVFNLSSEREFRNKHPEQGRFFPSRWYDSFCASGTAKPSLDNADYFNRWSRQLVERERELATAKASES